MQEEIGRRVAARMGAVCAGESQRAFAARVQMTPDSFSRALSGQRAFSSLELARIADALDADIHWLITGEPDPHRLVVAARHNFDFATGRRDVPGREDDEKILNDIGLAYRQAYQTVNGVGVQLPSSLDEIRYRLGASYVRPFAHRLESNLGVDVVRVAGLSTSYSFSVAGRKVIVVAATGNWFHENWSIAHELGHLMAGHHDDQSSTVDAHESAANAFAAELLLPPDSLRALDWVSISDSVLAERVWNSGVSTDALVRRLNYLSVPYSPFVAKWAEQPTQRLLRRHWVPTEDGFDPITVRMDDAASRRFPLSLQEEHLKMIAGGALGKGTLAWMLGIDPADLEIDSPSDGEEIGPDELAAALGLY
ncbi:helix-turn-helix domain-containing protein [Paenarthrobacter sp. NPDC090520]|uniref:helix-turn-helix domain-containing protein n=1 Tax=Paenarthrobacter sp. NPDC090520 TaxID=3364382 RepID=UPI00382E6F36